MRFNAEAVRIKARLSNSFCPKEDTSFAEYFCDSFIFATLNNFELKPF